MLLSEDQTVINALKNILKNYGCFEHDEVRSKNRDFLCVKLTRPKADRDISIAFSICRRLGQATRRSFLNPTSVGSGSRNSNTDGSHFNIREDKRTS